MKIEGFGRIDGSRLFAERHILTDIWCHEIHLYDRVIFRSDFATQKYICIYENSSSLVPQDTIDETACVIFERTINPYLDPKTYICIKVGNECREDLKKKENDYE